ncbi:chromatin modification- protein VID21 [Ceratobasidium sp. 392]|nr:chromatin modification- protein VID21 [Ceratobasidium sp. 392]
MTAAADARNALLARKSDERQTAASAREHLVRELLRATEWRAKAGASAFPHPSLTQDVPSKEALQIYLAASTDGAFLSLAFSLESTPEPEPEPEPELEPTPIASPPTPAPIIVPALADTIEPSAPSPAVKTEEDDTLMDSDAEGEEVADRSEPEEEDSHTGQEILRGPPPQPPAVIPPIVPISMADTPADSTSTPDEDVEMEPATPADPLPFAPPAQQQQPPSSPPAKASSPAPAPTPSPQRPRALSFKFDPNKPTNAPRPLSPPERDTRVPSVDTIRSLLFPTSPTIATAPSTAPATTAEPVAEPALPQTPHTPHTPHTRIPPASVSSPTTPKPLTTPYTASLPPLPPLPADLSRKVAGVKLRRRGAAGAAAGGVNWGGSGVWGIGGGGSGGAGGGMGVMGPGGGGVQAPAPGTNAAPSSTGMELLRWQAVLQINPAHAFARRPTKCVTTHEWRVLRHELEYTRAMQRIEQLKLDGAWSFRQPKKQREPVMSKTHWDYSMDGMKWLQVDLREERRWKTMLALKPAHAVRERHAAPAGSERKAAIQCGQRICTPAEHSKLQAERDARHYVGMMKRRQEIYQQAVAAGRPVSRMPAGLVNIPLNNRVRAGSDRQLGSQPKLNCGPPLKSSKFAVPHD